MKKGTLHFDVLPKHFQSIGMPNDIPILEGQHEYDVDVDENAMDEAIVRKMRDMCVFRMGLEFKRGVPDMPVGFDFNKAEKAGGTITWENDS